MFSRRQGFSFIFIKEDVFFAAENESEYIEVCDFQVVLKRMITKSEYLCI